LTSSRKTLSPSQARQKIYRYCAYQERCHHEVRNKLFEMGLRSNEVDELIVHLITEGFLNEERFAKAYAGGKFRMKNWGKNKIIHALEGKGVSSNCIKMALKEIDELDYRIVLRKILHGKKENADVDNPYVMRNKIAKHAIQKGFEPELVWTEIKLLFPE